MGYASYAVPVILFGVGALIGAAIPGLLVHGIVITVVGILGAGVAWNHGEAGAFQWILVLLPSGSG